MATLRFALYFSFLLFLSVPNNFAQTLLQKKAIDSVLTDLHHNGMFNGVVLLAENGKITYQKAMGISGPTNTKPLALNSSFNLASVSKQFMSMMTMILQEKGLLQYDDKVQKFLPEFPYPSISIRHLLTHTSGLEEYFDLALKYNNTLDTLNNQKLLQLLAQYRPSLIFEPGSSWQYCNTGYVVLASVIEKVSDQRIEIFFENAIAKPLKLKNSFIYYLNMPRPNSEPERVIGMERVNGKYQLNDLVRLDGVVGDGNVYSSAEDLLKWDQSLYRNILVKQATLQEAFTPVKLNNGNTHNYGFGWAIEDSGKTVTHTGGWVGFLNNFERKLSKKSTLIFLSSGSNNIANAVLEDILVGKTPKIPHTTLIQNVRIIDGTGNPAFNGSVRIMNNRIWEIGDLQPFEGEQVFNGNAKILAPGFIDTHSHHFGGLSKQPEAIPSLSQGVTTIVIGQDGGSYDMDTLANRIKGRPIAINVATYTGHASLREKVMGDNLLRIATNEEVKEMQSLLKAELDKGSLGLSTGLEYERGFYSNRDEVLQLAHTAANSKGRYISHIRSEDINIDEAIDEIIEIGRQAKLPVQVSHIKIAKKDKWGGSSALLAKLQQARAKGINITADIYPYDFWSSTLRVLFPNRDYSSLSSAQFAVDQLFDADNSLLIGFGAIPAYIGKTIGQIARERKETPAETLVKLVAMAESFEKNNPQFSGDVESIMGKSMDEKDVANFLVWPHANICSDGNADGHPRGYGAFTRVLGRYVREQKLMPLETAIYKMTGLAAENMGIGDRGLIKPGHYADLVLFNPDTVQDNATINNNKALSTGIEMVWVNGELVYQTQKPTNKYSGVLIKRPGTN